MTALLTFLGTGVYDTVTYVWKDADGERLCRTHLFPEAAARIFNPDRLVVLLTSKAREFRAPKGTRCPQCGQVLPEPREEKTYLEILRQRLGKTLWIDEVSIPDGSDEKELWEIFEKCSQAVAEGEEVILDITHAYRSLPLVVFAAAAYLRRTKKVNLRHIIYGAYEARSSSETGDRAPVFDMTPLLELVDWLSEADFFLRRGDASLLGQRLRKIQHAAWKAGAGNDLPKELQKLGRILESLSKALHFARPLEAMRSARGLASKLAGVGHEVDRWAKPFGAVLEQLRSEAERIAHDDPQRLDQENLRKQLQLIHYLVDKGLYTQASLLAREWLISWLALTVGQGDWLDEKYRSNALEQEFNEAASHKHQKPAHPSPEEVHPEAFERPAGWEKAVRLWIDLSQLRNDLAHCGMRKSPVASEKLVDGIRNIAASLDQLMGNAPARALEGGRVFIDLQELYGDTAKLEELNLYLDRAKEQAGEGRDVVITGHAPIWLYLAVAHALHGKARRLWYRSPVTDEVLIFDHSSE